MDKFPVNETLYSHHDQLTRISASIEDLERRTNVLFKEDVELHAELDELIVKLNDSMANLKEELEEWIGILVDEVD